ncbi:MAG: ATP-binding protein [Clostridia bacterium]|nr:ATP-binding protein [Clostridia bacterium]
MNDPNNQNTITIPLSGRIDSNNASSEEERIRSLIGPSAPKGLVLDAEKLDYISSAGLRILLRLRKECSDLRMVNVSSDVYEILEMTGFTEMIGVEKAFRRISVENCEIIGEGFNAAVYRIDSDTVVKVYKHGEGLEEIKRERETARLALILGVPTAISYDVVKVGNSFGSVFELLNARSFSKIIAEEPERMSWCVKEYVDMLHVIHAISVPEGKLPPVKEEAIGDVQRMKHLLDPEHAEKLMHLVNAVADTDNMLHGDYHTQNIVLADGEVLLIDMDTLCVGHPVFELARIYRAYVGFSEYDPAIVLKFQGFDADTAKEFWQRSLRAYLNTDDEAFIAEVEAKARCIAYSDMIDWRIRHMGLDTDEDRATVELWKKELCELLDGLTELDFDAGAVLSGGQDANALEVEAERNSLEKVMDFVSERLVAAGFPPKLVMRFSIAVEEIFVNIADYAYPNGSGTVKVRTRFENESAKVVFIDSGIRYDPLAKPDPDLDLPASERRVGGLGIFMTKKLADDISYEYRDGKNILTLELKLPAGGEPK